MKRQRAYELTAKLLNYLEDYCDTPYFRQGVLVNDFVIWDEPSVFRDPFFVRADTDEELNSMMLRIAKYVAVKMDGGYVGQDLWDEAIVMFVSSLTVHY